MNIELLRRIQARILAEPQRFGMGNWFVMDFFNNGCVVEPEQFEECGTTACLAGWACVLSGQALRRMKVFEDAARLLDLTEAQATRLFFDGHWPWGFCGEYHLAKDSNEEAKVAAERIEFFIQTNGTDDPALIEEVAQ